MPFRLLLLQHLINSVFPDNEDRTVIEKFLQQRLVGQNPFVLIAAALQCPAAPFLHLRLIFLIDPYIFLEAKDLAPYPPYHGLGRFVARRLLSIGDLLSLRLREQTRFTYGGEWPLYHFAHDLQRLSR